MISVKIEIEDDFGTYTNYFHFEKDGGTWWNEEVFVDEELGKALDYIQTRASEW